jgi:hypothetical protein
LSVLPFSELAKKVQENTKKFAFYPFSSGKEGLSMSRCLCGKARISPRTALPKAGRIKRKQTISGGYG